jgi:hypothetical protein
MAPWRTGKANEFALGIVKPFALLSVRERSSGNSEVNIVHNSRLTNAIPSLSESLPISSIAIRNAFSLEPTKWPRQIRKSIFGSTTNTSHCGMHSLPRQAKMLGKEITNGSLMKRGGEFARGKRLIQKATEQLHSLMGQLRNCPKHW